MPTYTHSVAASAYIFNDRGELLLLQRRRVPLCWAPPGGRLDRGEDPVQGLLREVGEECGLDVEVLGLAGAWFGCLTPGGQPLIGLDYVCQHCSGMVRLSSEHDTWAWVSRRAIREGRIPLADEHGAGYRLEDLELAWELYSFYRRRRRGRGEGRGGGLSDRI